ncbi:hypothetical protein ZIOFF_075129 [Zingiber officinale]|uniref:Uncharacterized protein n=1 Tax=Zingiber officinale TaxID=94328 RepID=A0A8J5B9E7_ZINOF|nr:hypothetical protein ZIOFF_075129 [Zingiber officinale]
MTSGRYKVDLFCRGRSRGARKPWADRPGLSLLFCSRHDKGARKRYAQRAEDPLRVSVVSLQLATTREKNQRSASIRITLGGLSLLPDLERYYESSVPDSIAAAIWFTGTTKKCHAYLTLTDVSGGWTRSESSGGGTRTYPKKLNDERVAGILFKTVRGAYVKHIASVLTLEWGSPSVVWEAILKLIFLLDRVFSKVFCYRPSLNGFLGYIRDVEFRQKQVVLDNLLLLLAWERPYGYGKGSVIVHALPLLPLDQWDPNLDFLGRKASLDQSQPPEVVVKSLTFAPRKCTGISASTRSAIGFSFNHLSNQKDEEEPSPISLAHPAFTIGLAEHIFRQVSDRVVPSRKKTDESEPRAQDRKEVLYRTGKHARDGPWLGAKRSALSESYLTKQSFHSGNERERGEILFRNAFPVVISPAKVPLTSVRRSRIAYQIKPSKSSDFGDPLPIAAAWVHFFPVERCPFFLSPASSAPLSSYLESRGASTTRHSTGADQLHWDLEQGGQPNPKKQIFSPSRIPRDEIWTASFCAAMEWWHSFNPRLWTRGIPIGKKSGDSNNGRALTVRCEGLQALRIRKSILRKIRASKYRSGAQVMVFGMSVDGGFCPIVSYYAEDNRDS